MSPYTLGPIASEFVAFAIVWTKALLVEASAALAATSFIALESGSMLTASYVGSSPWECHIMDLKFLRHRSTTKRFFRMRKVSSSVYGDSRLPRAKVELTVITC